MLKRLLRKGVWVSLLIVASGCQFGHEAVLRPYVRVLGVELIEQTQDGVCMDLILAVENPNLIPLPLVHSDYTITVEGFDTYRFSDNPNKTAPPGLKEGGNILGEQKLRLPFAFAVNGADPSRSAYQVRGSIFYQPPGAIRKLMTESKIELPSVLFEGSGQIE